MSNTSWEQAFPRLVSKNDLRGKKLHTFADHPPEPASKRGMYNLTVFEVDTDKKYTVLITAQDLDKIIEVITDSKKPSPRHFTFDQSEPWAEVIAFES